MYFLGLGLLLLVMKSMEISPVVGWPWLAVLAPFGFAVLWWWWADSTGYTKKKVMQRENAKRQARIDRTKEAIGTLNRKKRR
jgi:small Trp-rich protein